MNKDLSLITKYTDDDLVIYKDGSSGYDDTFSGDLSGGDYKNYDSSILIDLDSRITESITGFNHILDNKDEYFNHIFTDSEYGNLRGNNIEVTYA